MSKNLSTSFASSLILNTYEQLLRSQRSRSLSKTKSSNIFAKIKSVSTFKHSTLKAELPKSASKIQVGSNLKKKAIQKPDIRSLNDSIEPKCSTFISPQSKIFSDLFTVLKKSKNPEELPSKNPAFEKPPQNLTQNQEFFNKLQKPSSKNFVDSSTEDTESMKYGSYQNLLNLYESEKEARLHFEGLNDKSNAEKETLIKSLEIVKRNFEWFASQDSDDNIREQLRNFKEQSESENEKLSIEIHKVQESLKKAQISESRLKDQVKNLENLNKTKEESHMHIQKLQHELNFYKSAELLQSQPYELKTTPRSHCESCETQINTLNQSLLTMKSENAELRQKLQQQRKPKEITLRSASQDQITEKLHLMDKSELLDEFTKLKSENSEILKRLLNQADETFEKNKEIVELSKHKTELYKELIEVKMQVSELEELRAHVDYLMERIRSMREKILNLAELYKSSLNKNKTLANLEDYQKSMNLIEELVRTNIEPVKKKSKIGSWKEKLSKTYSGFEIIDDKSNNQ